MLPHVLYCPGTLATSILRKLLAPAFLLMCLHLAYGESEQVLPKQRFTSSVGLEFVLIPGGMYTMGGDVVVGTTQHRHVTLSTFYSARNGVTKSEFRLFLKETGRPGNVDELGPSPSGWDFISEKQWKKIGSSLFRVG